MKKRILLFFLVSCYLLTFGLLKEIEFENNISINEDGYNNTYKYTVKTNTDFPEYINIQLKKQDKSEKVKIPVIYFSSTNENCLDDREQMSLSYSSTSEMFIKKSQIKGKKFYLCIECPKLVEMATPFTLKFNSGTKAVFPEINSNYIHSYYVSDNNKKMNFEFILNQVDNIKISIFIRGNKITQSVLNYYSVSIKGKQFKYGYAYIYDPSRYSIPGEPYSLEIDSEEGDFISIEIKEIIEGISVPLRPTPDEISGYLKRDFFEEECFSIENLMASSSKNYIIINGVIYTKYASVLLKYKNNNYIQDSESLYSNGVINKIIGKDYSKEVDIGYFCIKIPKDNEEIQELLYSLQIDNRDQYNNVYLPLFNGIIYQKTLEQGNIGIYPSTKQNFEKKINYNVFSHIGEIRVYFHQCDTYPLCTYDEKILQQSTEIKRPHNINRMFTWSEVNITSSMNPISRQQNLVIVQCISESSLCKFDISIFSDKNTINLEEKQNYYQYILKGENDKYTINLEGESSIVKLYLDVMILSGDAVLEVPENEYYTVHKYMASNKLFCSITFSKKVESIDISIKALINTFYVIGYSINRENSDLSKNYLESGINYLETIDPELKTKNIFIHNLRSYNDDSFFINFYSLNCQYNIKRKEKKVEIIDYYAQDIITKNDSIYNNEYYEYEINILKNDTSTHYKGELCMLYISAVELEGKDQLNVNNLGRQIVISENIPQQIIFTEEINNIKYLFPHARLDKSLFLNLNLIDEGSYTLKIYFNYFLSNNIISNLTRSQQIGIFPQEWLSYCPDEKESCNIIIDITLDKKYLLKEPMLEFFVRTENAMPTYFCKTLMKKDFSFSTQFQYFYTGVGKDEVGEIVVNFPRGSGKIYGKIVSQNLRDPEEGADWRGLYKLPSSFDKNELNFDPYLKKLFYDQEDTNKCDKGCYLILGIQSSIKGETFWEGRLYPFTILPHSSPAKRTSADISIISVPINEYIIGNVAKATSNNIYEFYSAWIPYDGDKIVIDWQSNMGNLYIKIGSSRPSKTDYDFKFLGEGHDTIFSISKTDIMNKVLVKKMDLIHENSIKDLEFIIGIICDEIDSIYTTLYSFKIHVPRSPNLDIIPVNSDQKNICNLTKDNNSTNYRCLFVVLYEDIDILNNLIIHSIAQNPYAKTSIYGSFVEAPYIENYDTSYLSKHIPTKKNCEFSSDKLGQDYLFVSLGQGSGQHLFISVYSDQEGIIELLTSFYTYDKLITPNPSTPQLFFLQKEKMNFNFTSSKDVLVNIVSLSGEAKIYWELEPKTVYYLRGRQDRLELTLGTDEEDKKYSKLIIENLNPQEDLSREDPGFSFYLSYDIRPLSQNFDILEYGKSTQVAYRNADFPLVLYSRLLSFNKDVNIMINFYELEEISEASPTMVNVNQKLFEIRGYVVSEELIYQKKINGDINPSIENEIKGVYDHSTRTANLFFQNDNLKKFKITLEQRPYLYIIITKTNYNSLKYKKINLEGAILPSGTNIFSPEKLYQHGKLSLMSDFNLYRLRTDEKKKKMRIHFSANSGFINWCVNLDKSFNNDTNLIKGKKYELGKSIIDIDVPENTDEIFLKVFYDNKRPSTDSLSNYVFKYMNGYKIENFISFKPDDSSIEVTTRGSGDDAVLKIKFKSIKVSGTQNIIYYVKFLSSSDLINNESINTIALSESSPKIIQFNNPSDTYISYSTKVSEISKNLTYIMVIAEITDKTIREYVVYDTKIINLGTVFSKDLIFWILVIVIIILVIVSIIFAFFWIKGKKRNKDLMEKVNKTSFNILDENKKDSEKDVNLLEVDEGKIVN